MAGLNFLGALAYSLRVSSFFFFFFLFLFLFFVLFFSVRDLCDEDESCEIWRRGYGEASSSVS